MAVRRDIVTLFQESIADERDRQVEKFGDQAGEELNLPVIGTSEGYTARTFGYCAEAWKNINARAFPKGKGGWDGILLEEVFEALAEEDPEKMEAELVQVAAVACAMYEASRRRREPKPGPRIDWSHLGEGRTPHRDADLNVPKEALSNCGQTAGPGEEYFWTAKDGWCVRPVTPKVEWRDPQVPDTPLIRRTRPTEGVSWDELVGDPVLGTGVAGEGDQSFEMIPSHIAQDPDVVDYFLNGAGRAAMPKRETRPFGSCCPHGPVAPDPVGL